MSYNQSVRLWIEGVRFGTLHDVVSEAQQRGGPSADTVRRRLKDGACTWAEICAPADDRKAPQGKLGAAATAKRRKESRAECAALLAAIDARRREMGQ